MFLRRSDKIETLIGQRSEFKGDVTTEGTIRIDGRFIGNITAEWVIIGDSGYIKGNITSKGIIIGGIVEGNLKSDDIVEIKSTGRLTGDIHTKKLSVSEGGMFEGRSFIKREDDGKVIDFPIKESASM
ncbi:MAG: polymer-forming cytoskeletal protein [Thermodesulfovibrionales bacterium]|nr:polymer-forming cytoskeletal protein [Thermodesulfovibrionales bacterium]